MTIGVVIVSALVIGVAILAFKSYNGGWSHESQEKKEKESKKRRAKKKSSSSDDDSDTDSKVKSGLTNRRPNKRSEQQSRFE